MKIVRTPLFFGRDHRSLFGWFHAPAGGARGDLAVVICPPICHEYVNSHRPVRHLAESLANAGVPVLRFDYEGTGNSAGRDEDPNRVGAWTESVREAIQEVRELSDCRRIGLVGVRFGATLAVAAAAEVEVACLVLWAPCVRGQAFAREMKALHLTGAKSNADTAAGAIEPGGFLMTDDTQREIGCLDLEGVSPKTKRALILTRDDFAEDTRLRDTWAAAGILTEQRMLSGFTQMFLPPHSAVIPSSAIGVTVEWITADSTCESPLQPADDRLKPVRTHALISGEIRESIVHHDGVFGILTEPAASPNGEMPTILLPNAGSAHHVGPNRLYVLLTRRLASAGFRCLRFDLPGLGDSVVNDIATENIPYLPTASSVIKSLIATMKQQRHTEAFLLMGLCSGAHTSFHAALDLNGAPIVESMMINPLTFYYTPGMPLDPSPTNLYDGWPRHLAPIRTLERGLKLLRRSVRIAFYRFRDIRPTTALALRRRGSNNGNGHPNDLEVDLRQIVQSGRKLTFVFSRFDPGYDLLMINAAPLVKQFQKKGLIRLCLIDDANHTFEARNSREVMFESVVRHLSERYGSSIV